MTAPWMMAFDFSDLVYPIALLIMAAASGLQHILKKKDEPESSSRDQVIIIPPPRRQQSTARQTPTGGAQPSRPPTPPAPPVKRAPTGKAPVRPAPRSRPQVPRPVIKVQPRPKKRPAPPTAARPAKPLKRERITPMQHAEQVSEHAEHAANKLREEVLIKSGKLEPGQHQHGPAKPLHRPARVAGIGVLKPKSMQQAVLLSEILRPPIALREQGHRMEL